MGTNLAFAQNSRGDRVAQERGYAVRVRCTSLGERKDHAECKLHIAARRARDVAYYDFMGEVADSYWIPLAGSETFFVHFTTDITE
jgi:hypothetical protein